MIQSQILKIKKINNFDNTYIENQLESISKEVIRWAIVEIDNEYITVSYSYI